MARGVNQLGVSVAGARPRTKKRGLGASRRIILLVALLVSVAAGYVGYQRFSPTVAPVAQPTTAPVSKGTLLATVNIMGSTAAMFQSKLTFETAGRLTKVFVKAGDTVKEGDVLAKVDTSDLELQVAQAQVTLEQAKLKLDQLETGAKPEDLASAEASVRDAELALVNAKDSLILVNKSATVTKNIRDRQYELNWYEVRYGETLDKFSKGQANQSDLDRDWANLMTAREKLDSAKIEADMAVRKADNDVLRAQDTLTKAKTQLENLKTGTSATDISAQELSVRQAEATLKQRQLSLQKASLTAPFDGIIDSVSGNVGEQVSTSKEVMTIVNMQRFRVDARVDETDVSRLAVGQVASITVEALSSERLTARVTSIAATPVTQQGVVNYPVTLELNPTRATVRPGMTASVAVEVVRREDVLLVPNRAVRTSGRTRTVEVMVNGKPEAKIVNVGLSNDQFTEVVDGVREGDVVVIPATTTSNPRGGLGGIPSGGMSSGGMVVPGQFGR